MTTPDEDSAFAMVSSRRADLTLRLMTVAVHAIKRRGWFNLKVAGRVAGYDNLLRMGVRPQAAALVPLLNQGIAAITAAERAEIANRHVSITVRTGIAPEMVRNIVVVAAVALLTSLFWGVKLKRLNARLRRQSRTDSLTGLGNRAYLNEHLGHEISRAQRNGGALSLILLDIDHFKRYQRRFRPSGRRPSAGRRRRAAAARRAPDRRPGPVGRRGIPGDLPRHQPGPCRADERASARRWPVTASTPGRCMRSAPVWPNCKTARAPIACSPAPIAGFTRPRGRPRPGRRRKGGLRLIERSPLARLIKPGP